MRHRPAADYGGGGEALAQLSAEKAEDRKGLTMPRQKKAPELTFQRHIADYLVREHKYGVLDQSDIIDSDHCIAEDQLWAFLNASQADTLTKLVDDYGIPKLSLERFQKVQNVSDYMTEFLVLYGHTIETSQPMYVQKAIRVPEPNLLVSSTPTKRDHMKRDIPHFASLINETGRTEQFKMQFQNETRKLLHILHDPAQQWLLKDFQFLLTTNGTLYYLDFDRGYFRHNVDKHGTMEDMIGNVNITMNRLLYWLTGANGNFTGLEMERFCVANYRC